MDAPNDTSSTMTDGLAILLNAQRVSSRDVLSNRNSRTISDDFIDATLASLKIIGKLRENDRLAIRNGHICLEPSSNSPFVRAVSRWVHGDSRETTLQQLKRIISNVMSIDELAMMTLEPSHDAQWTLAQMCKEMDAARAGLENLKATYENDSTMQVNLEVLIERLVDHREKVREFMTKVMIPVKSTAP